MNELQSMTGFSTAEKSDGQLTVSCDMRSVNGKNLDIRLRLPSGFEVLESTIKKQISQSVMRGNLQVSISLTRTNNGSAITIDKDVFRSIATKASKLAKEHGLAAPTADGVLSVRGVVLSDESNAGWFADEDEKASISTQITATVAEATASLADMRAVEGASLKTILTAQLADIENLTAQAKDDEASSPTSIMARLQAQITALLDEQSDERLDPVRLNAEAALLATKADIREEIDRLSSHVKAARDMLDGGGAIGRKLDFLSQEFNRETNTICSKSASATLTSTGLALKAVIDQFREQVQNLQ